MSLKKFLLATAYVFGYLGAWALILLVGLRVFNPKVNEGGFLMFVLVSTVVLLIGFLPYLNFSAKRAFYFKGEGPPLAMEELRKSILAINLASAPVMVMEKGREIIVTWNYLDAKWWEILAKAGFEKVYELHVKFNDAEKEVILIDVLKNVKWRLGPGHTKVSGGYFRGICAGFERGQRWGIKEDFRLGKIYDFKFSPSEIRNPVANTILNSGWSIRLGMW